MRASERCPAIAWPTLMRNDCRRGFTLLEIILAMGIAFVLLAALFQAINLHATYDRIARQRSRETLVARTLLHRIADELRAVLIPPPRLPRATPDAAPLLLWPRGTATHAREMLALAADPTEIAEDYETSTSSPDRFDRENLLWRPAQFGLLGTHNRLIMRTRRSQASASVVEQFQQESGGLSGQASAVATVSALTEEQRRYPGDVRQVFYLLKPLEEAFGAGTEELPVTDQLAETGLGEEEEPEELGVDGEPLEPVYQGLIRQEVSRPFSLLADAEARYQLEQALGLDQLTEAGLADASMEQGPAETGDSSDEMKPIVSTQLLVEEITAIRFRYHDGRQWREQWTRTNVLPLAVEISLSFDPRAADPAFLEEIEQTEREHSDVPAAAEPEEEAEQPIFPYKLVVAIPGALATTRRVISPRDRPVPEDATPPDAFE